MRRWSVALALCATLAALCLAGTPAGASAEGNAVLDWGVNNNDSLALGWESQTEPSPQTVLGLTGVVNAVAGGFHTGYALVSEGEGTVKAWGDNDFGQLGNGTRTASSTPVTVGHLHKVSAISAAGYHAMALSEGKVWAWGAAQAGEDGNGTSGVGRCAGETLKCCEESAAKCEPVEVPGLSKVIAIASGGASDFAITEEGGTTQLWAWGGDVKGILGIGEAPEECEVEGGGLIPCSTKPVQVKFEGLPEGVHVTQVSSGVAAETEVQNAYALLSNGKVMSWGANGHGSLGNGTTTNSNVPVEVDMEAVNHEEEVQLHEVSPVVSLSGGAGYALARLADKHVIGWGSDIMGQLGPTASEDCGGKPADCECKGITSSCDKLPQLVGGLNEVSALAVGDSYNLALSGGKVYAWGRNSPDGQLGIGDEIGPETCGEETNGSGESVPLLCARTPTAIPNLEGVESIAAGFTGGDLIVPSEPLPAPAIALIPEHGQMSVKWTFPLSGLDPKYKIRWRTWASNPEEDGPYSPKKLITTSCSAAEPCALAMGRLEERPYEVVVTTLVKIHEGPSEEESEYRTLNARQIVGTPLPPPVKITALSPSLGPAGGGTSVSISGSNFEAGAKVHFGGPEGTAATSVTVNSPTSITAVAPTGTGTVEVTVSEPAGLSGITPADLFTYIPAPVVKKLEPNSGPATGGTTVTITGSNFGEASAVKFGGVNAASFTVTSATSITAVAPAESVGSPDVRVTTPGGTSEMVSADKFNATPTIISISPTSGPSAGGTWVSITGTGFAIGTTKIKFGATKSTAVECTSSTSCLARAPAHAVGTVDVTATVEKVESPTSEADRFTYF